MGSPWRCLPVFALRAGTRPCDRDARGCAARFAQNESVFGRNLREMPVQEEKLSKTKEKRRADAKHIFLIPTKAVWTIYWECSKKAAPIFNGLPEMRKGN